MFTVQILPILLPFTDSGGNCSGIVVLRLLDLFVIFEFKSVALDELAGPITFGDIGGVAPCCPGNAGDND